MIKDILLRLKEGYFSLEKEKYVEALEIFDRVLEIDPSNANAHIGKLLAEKRVKSVSELETLDEPFVESENYKNALKYADKETISTFDKCLSAIRKRQTEEKERKEKEEILKKEAAAEEELLKEQRRKQEAVEAEQEIIVESVRKQRAKKKRKNKIIVISFASFTVLLVSVLAAFFVFKSDPQVKKAKELYDSGKYLEAYIIFDEAGAFEEKNDMESSLDKIASKLVSAGDYETVVSLASLMNKEIPLLEAYKKVLEGDYNSAVKLGLTKFTFPKGNTIVQQGTFYGCSDLEEITILEGVTLVESFAFDGCSSLKRVVLPDGIELLEENVFANCSSLEVIHIPKSVRFVGRGAFLNCESLEAVSFEDEKRWYSDKDEYIFLSERQTALEFVKNPHKTWTKS